jgi:hypothetical protein
MASHKVRSLKQREAGTWDRNFLLKVYLVISRPSKFLRSEPFLLCRFVNISLTKGRKEKGLDIPFRVRSGRHSYEAYSIVEDGLVIDLTKLQQKSYDPNTTIAEFGAGLR